MRQKDSAALRREYFDFNTGRKLGEAINTPSGVFVWGIDYNDPDWPEEEFLSMFVGVQDDFESVPGYLKYRHETNA